MNHKILSSLTASLLIATVGFPLATSAQTTEASNPGSEPSREQASSTLGSVPQSEASSPNKGDVARLDNQTNEIVKVGEQLSQSATQAFTEGVAKVQPHEVSGRSAATLYVRNIPILTFLGDRAATSNGVKVGTQATSSSEGDVAKAKTLDSASPSNLSMTSLLRASQSLSDPASNEFKLEALNDSTADPVWRASVIAARINQLYRDGIKANSISVSWVQPQQDSNPRDRLVIRANKVEIAALDNNTILPDSTRNLEQDALQATNRLRRVLGNAAPLRQVSGEPGSNDPSLSFGPFRFQLTGFASWYGPGFHGNPCASGERFNQHDLTAAHRTLPFGTRVLVTNLDNGQSVVVRINDRGPFHANRVIDVSTGAARVLGLIQSGVARVRLDVIDSRSASATTN